uniref:Uncharacterized protein n=1 Tax=Strongyloides venezuelensis TaxID=75913 RepID=A0A0K0FH73_STRVS
MSKFENTVIDDTPSHTGLVVFIIVAGIAGLVIFSIIVFLLISSSRRKHFQNRMASARRSLVGSLRGRQNPNASQVSPSSQQNIIIDSAYLSPTHMIGLSPPKYDSAPPSYDEVINSQTDPTPPYTPRRVNPSTAGLANTSMVDNVSRTDTITIIPRRQLEEESQPRGNNSSAVIQVTEIVTGNRSKSPNKPNDESNSCSKNPQIFANNDTNIPKPHRLEEGKSRKEENINSSNTEIPNLENVQIS